MLKIIGGEYKSRRLASPVDAAVTRPYTNRVKETVFNLLRGWFEGAIVIDLFAGVGTMGLEAASRGTKQVMLVEQNRDMAALAKQNINALGCGDRVELMQADALSSVWIARAPRPVDVLFIDPPYAMMEDPVSQRHVLVQIERCHELLARPAFVVLRSPIEPDETFTLSGYDGPEVHRYSKVMRVLLYAPASDEPSG